MFANRPWLKVSIRAVLVLLLLLVASFTALGYFSNLSVNPVVTPVVYCLVQIALIVRGRYAESKNVVHGGIVAAAVTVLLMLFVNASHYATWQRFYQVVAAMLPLAAGLLTTLATFLVDTRYTVHKCVKTIYELLFGVFTGFTVGFVIGMGLYFLYDKGYFYVQWRYLTAAPPEAITLALGERGELYGRTFGDEYLHYRYDGWEISGEQVDVGRLHNIVMPCHLTGAPMSFLSRPPKNIVACVEIAGLEADGAYRYAYALDVDNNIWIWTLITYGTMGMAFFIGLPALGGILGLVLVLLRRIDTRVRSQTQFSDNV